MTSIALVQTDRDLGAEILAAHEAAYGATCQALQHARQAGDLLIEAKSRLTHGDWLPWLAQHCAAISERTVQNYMRIAREWPRLETQIKSATVADLPLRDALKLLTPPRETFNSGDSEWYSPQAYVQLARQVMGGIDLDPMSSATANGVVQATTFFDAETDGLQQPWRGRLWANPPYVNKTMEAFVAKLIADYESGEVEAAIVLMNSASEVRWFHALMAGAPGVCLPRGRAQYWRADHRELTSGSPLQGQALFYFGHRFDRFAGVFADVGLVLTAAAKTTALAARKELVGW